MDSLARARSEMEVRCEATHAVWQDPTAVYYRTRFQSVIDNILSRYFRALTRLERAVEDAERAAKDI